MKIMKYNILKLGIAMTLLFSANACSDDDKEMTNDNSVLIQEAKEVATNGSWIISSYIESTIDQTSNFSGYTFTFNTDGTLIAIKDSSNIEGTWSVTDDDSSMDDSPDDDIDFNIFFTNPTEFSELSEDWEIRTINSSTIELRHISGGDGDIDTLTFVKSN